MLIPLERAHANLRHVNHHKLRIANVITKDNETQMSRELYTYNFSVNKDRFDETIRQTDMRRGISRKLITQAGL